MEDLQSLLEKINREGVEKAEAKANEIIARAKADADAIMKNAREEATKAKADAERAAADYTRRAEETLRQAARDTVLNVESAVTKLLEKLLSNNVNKVLSDEAAVTALVADVIKLFAVKGEIAAGEKLAAALSAQLATSEQFKVVTDENLDTGFSVRLDNGRVEHSFTGQTVADELAKRLRGNLAALLK